MATYVLIHGAWHGGWVWREVTQRLTAAGHEVYAPTLTGCGDRFHLGDRHIDLSTHIQDVAALIEWEALGDFILVGHSYGCAVATAIADRYADQITALACLDGFVLQDGENTWGFNGPQQEAFLKGASLNHGRIPPVPAEKFKVRAELRASVEARVRPMPLPCFLERLNLTGAIDRIPAKSFVHCNGWGPSPFDAIHDRLDQNEDWRVMQVACGHHWMIDHPEDCADYLAALS